jgi:hypothetical protein
MPKSNFLRSELITGKLGTGTITEPANMYVALYTSDPTAADSGTEVTGGSYARVSTATNGTDWTASDTDTWANAVAITFPTSSAAWSSSASITHVGLRDASSGGNLHWYEALTTPRTVTAAGVTLSFAIGAITISES